MRHLVIIIWILISVTAFGQKKDLKKQQPAKQDTTFTITLEKWVVDDLNTFDSEIQRVNKVVVETQTYLQVLQIRKEDLIRNTIRADKTPGRMEFEKIGGYDRVGNTLILKLKPDSLLNKVKADTVKNK